MNYHKHLDIERDVIINAYSNPYYWNNPDFFVRLRAIVKTYHTNYSTILARSAADICSWMSEMLPELSDRQYRTSTKVFWILSGMTDFRECKSKNCGSKVGIGQNVSVTRGYCDFCSLKCSQPDQKTRTKVKESVEKRLADDPDFFKKVEGKKRATKVSRGKQPTWNNRELAEATCVGRYGTKHPMQNKDVAGKTASTKNAKYGDKAYTNRRLFVKTMLERYCVEWPMQDRAMAERGIRSKLEKYGTTTPARRYEYDGAAFDSKPELAFYVWLKDSGLEFEYHPESPIEFSFNGKPHIYLPDFEVGGKLIEIKGDQFFRPDGTMYCPYRNRNWSDEQYAETCALYEAKHQCMVSHGVKILKSKEYAEYLAYVEERYGKEFFSKHKRAA